MPASTATKIIAQIIKAYRTSYLASAKIVEAGGIRRALLKAFVNSKMMQPTKMTQISKISTEDFIKMAKKGFTP